MALEISEFDARAGDVHGGINVFARPALAVHSVAIGGTSAESDPFNEHTRFVRLVASADCRIRFSFADDSVAATADDEFFGTGEHTVAVDAGMVLAVIAA